MHLSGGCRCVRGYARRHARCSDLQMRCCASHKHAALLDRLWECLCHAEWWLRRSLGLEMRK